MIWRDMGISGSEVWGLLKPAGRQADGFRKVLAQARPRTLRISDRFWPVRDKLASLSLPPAARSDRGSGP